MWSWKEKARCQGIPTEVFFPEARETADAEVIRQVCSACPVQIHCLIAGLAEDDGYWGGHNITNRRMWRRELGLHHSKSSTLYEGFKPLLDAIFADEKHVGIVRAFISNMPDRTVAARWMKRVRHA